MEAQRGLTAEQAKKLIERRETLFHISAMFHVIIGARILTGTHLAFDGIKREVENKNDHAKILTKLIEMGANLMAKDFAGHTPLHHCVTSFGNSTTLTMAEMLLEAGADPNIQNRFGCPPLNECVMASKVEAIKLLMKHGARPDIKENNEGLTCFDLAKNHPRIMTIFSKAGKKSAKAAREELKTEAGGSLRMCGGICGGTGGKRCTGCYLVRFSYHIIISVLV